MFYWIVVLLGHTFWGGVDVLVVGLVLCPALLVGWAEMGPLVEWTVSE